MAAKDSRIETHEKKTPKFNVNPENAAWAAMLVKTARAIEARESQESQKGMGSVLVRIFRKIWGEFLPPLEAYLAGRRLQYRLDQLLTDDGRRVFPLGGVIPEEALAQMRADCEAELSRRQRIVDRGTSALLAVGLTMVMSAGFLFQAEIDAFQLGVLGSAFVYLAAAALCVTTAVNVQPRYGIFLDDLVGVNDDGKLQLVPRSARYEAEELYNNGKLNQLATLKISNYVSAAYSSIRNAVVLLLVFFFLFLT